MLVLGHPTGWPPLSLQAYLIRYFVNGLGRDAHSCAQLMSYLLFASRYTSALIDIGYDDARKRIDEIESFFYSSDDRDSQARKDETRIAA